MKIFICTKCKEYKLKKEMSVCSRNKNKLSSHCKKCKIKYANNSKIKNLLKVKEYQKKYRQKNKIKLQKQLTYYYQKNKKELCLKSNKYYEKNSDYNSNFFKIS